MRAHAVGIAGIVADQTFPVTITGALETSFIPEEKRRFIQEPSN
jgi:hypothetical protein